MEAYKRGGHTVWDCKYHLVWVTKYRYAVLGTQPHPSPDDNVNVT
jgi:REP element-mobilizing transposase RayT